MKGFRGMGIERVQGDGATGKLRYVIVWEMVEDAWREGTTVLKNIHRVEKV